MTTRAEKDIWEGLNEFYVIESKRQLSDSNTIQLIVDEKGFKRAIVIKKDVAINQILSHQEIRAKFFEVRLSTQSDWSSKKGKFYSLKEIERLAKPVIITEYLKKYVE